MPVLAAYIDTQNVSILLYISHEEYYLYNFPYVYSNDVFSASYSESTFYQAVFDYFCKQHKLKLSDCDVVISGFLEPPRLDFNLKYYISLFDLIRRVNGYFPILVNNYSIFTQQGFYCWDAVKGALSSEEMMDSEEVNFYSNTELYPQLVATDLSTQSDIDRNILGLLGSAHLRIPDNQPLIFGGSRFTQINMVPELDYMMILNLIQQEGVFDIRIDRNNSAILFALLNLYDSNINMEPTPELEGTVISTFTGLECMVKSEVGTSQVVQLDKNRIFVLPVGLNERPAIMLKSPNIDTLEKRVSGGRMGIIFDTRENKGRQIDDFRVFNSGIKSFSNALGI
ncbi:hypothetical protein A2415_03640 [candidate division WWE3 bacterium RIFOXYC1_FULL_39_7]|uniref:Uncharacterized protein n=2 Tax=Katanobacteria TaxID=422282 RepID=A0A1F4X7S4_UNCKA|nr:MAG: hypothetical protein A2415_03640 [candidate division WWE3 bacterium RIFOXYC1_FULL_39_7]OGC77591.1 MAG: hypothetical protein A2619_04500 [candidate division WWE3 bacterium RIFOXYD1_FULL_39_9]